MVHYYCDEAFKLMYEKVRLETCDCDEIEARLVDLAEFYDEPLCQQIREGKIQQLK